jgi:type IV pilus modification protein PilV
MGVGLLGMLSLQNTAIKFSQAALLDSQARYAINDLVERVRMNTKVDASNAQYYALSQASSIADPGNPCDTGTNNCNAQQLSKWDVWTWLTALQNTLPGAKADVSYLVGKSELTVTVSYSTANLNQAIVLTGSQTNNDDPTLRRITVRTRIK